MRTSLFLVSAVAALGYASAFAPGAINMPLKSARASRSVSLKAMAEVEGPPKPTLGLAKPVLEGNELAEDTFRFLQQTNYIKEREGFLMGEMFADAIIRNGGFSEFAETLNGRVAQVAFPLGLASTFQGDILYQLADHPVKAILLCWVIAFASLPPLFESNEKDRRAAGMMRVLIPPGLSRGMMETYKVFDLDKIFTKEAERTNGRAAMAAFAFWLCTAILF